MRIQYRTYDNKRWKYLKVMGRYVYDHTVAIDIVRAMYNDYASFRYGVELKYDKDTTSFWDNY